MCVIFAVAVLFKGCDIVLLLAGDLLVMHFLHYSRADGYVIFISYVKLEQSRTVFCSLFVDQIHMFT